MDALASHLIIGAQMVCNIATSPSNSQGRQLSLLRNKFSLQPGLLEFNLATGRVLISRSQTCFQQTKLRFKLNKSHSLPKTYFLWHRMCHLMHVKTAAPYYFQCKPTRRRRSAVVLFSSFNGGQHSRKAVFFFHSCSLDWHIPTTVPCFFSSRVIACLLLWACSCHNGWGETYWVRKTSRPMPAASMSAYR